MNEKAATEQEVERLRESLHYIGSAEQWRFKDWRTFAKRLQREARKALTEASDARAI